MRLSKISLNHLSKAEMEKKEQNMLRGGAGYPLPCVCVSACACRYEGPQEGPDDSYYGGSTQENCDVIHEKPNGEYSTESDGNYY